MEESLSRQGKALIWVAVALTAAFYTFIFVSDLIEEVVANRLQVIMGCLLPFLVYSFVDTVKLKVTVTDQYVERKGIRTKRLLYKEVSRVFLSRSYMRLWSQCTRLTINFEVANRPVLVERICKHLKDTPGIRVTGDKKLVDKLFGPSV